MSDAVLEKLVEEVVALRRRVAHLEVLETGVGAADMLIGMIVPYSGALGGMDNHFPVDAATRQVDTRWHVCNGEVEQGRQTPDLRDRFIVGAGGSYSPGATGGAISHAHTYTQVPSHTHTMQSAGEHAHAIRNSAHTDTGSADGAVHAWNGTYIYTLSAGAHMHAIDAAGVSSPSTNSASSLPPYVALVYLMRVA